MLFKICIHTYTCKHKYVQNMQKDSHCQNWSPNSGKMVVFFLLVCILIFTMHVYCLWNFLNAPEITTESFLCLQKFNKSSVLKSHKVPQDKPQQNNIFWWKLNRGEKPWVLGTILPLTSCKTQVTLGMKKSDIVFPIFLLRCADM